jgi:hypothetical protein
LRAGAAGRGEEIRIADERDERTFFDDHRGKPEAVRRAQAQNGAAGFGLQ